MSADHPKCTLGSESVSMESDALEHLIEGLRKAGLTE